MATVLGQQRWNSKQVSSTTWLNMLTGDVGSGESVGRFAYRAIQVMGTLGAGGSINVQGSNDGVTWATLTDPQGGSLGTMGLGVKEIQEDTRFVRPIVVGGDGTTSISVALTVSSAIAVPSPNRQTVVIDDFYRPTDPVNDYTLAFERAQISLGSAGGNILCLGRTYMASRITLRRYVMIYGLNIAATELKQIAGSNQDFIISENFAALVGSAASAITNPLVPSWFGLANIRVNGNKFVAVVNPSGNTLGRNFAFYGTAIQMQNVLGYSAAEDGMYSEYTDAPDATDWRGQEEGDFTNITLRDNGGNGWLFRGPHNSKGAGITCGFNGLWGFRNETAAGYGGGFDYITSIHTYANGRSVSPAADTGCYLGEIARIGTIVTDGDNLVIAASNCQIGSWRGYNMGGQMSSEISGNANYIGSVNANLWVSSTGQTGIIVSGDANQIGAIRLTSNNSDNHGISITGNSNKLGPFFVQGFSTAGRIGVNLDGSKNRLVGEINGCATHFNYVAANTNNTVELELTTSGAEVPVAGATPGVTDRFSIRSSGTTAGGTQSSVQTGTFAMDITTVQNLSVTHGLLYTPQRYQVALTLLASSPVASGFAVDYLQVASCDATNVNITFKLGTAAGAGQLGRIGVVSFITQV